MELRPRHRKPGETFSALHQDIRKLMALAHRTLPQEARESIACDYYIDALNDDEFGLKVRERAPASLDEALRVSLQLEAWLKGARKKLDDSVRIREKVRGTVQPAASSDSCSSSSHLDERFSRLQANINKRMDEFLDRAQKSLSALQVQPVSDQSASTAAVNDRGATVSDSRHFAPHVSKPVGNSLHPCQHRCRDKYGPETTAVRVVLDPQLSAGDADCLDTCSGIVQSRLRYQATRQCREDLRLPIEMTYTSTRG